MSICYIDGIPYMASLPTGGDPNGTTPCEWDDREAVFGSFEDKLARFSIYSWCRDSNVTHTVRGCLCYCRGLADPNTWSNICGYRPDLIPLDPITLEPDPGLLAHIPDGQECVFGSLYMNDTVVPIVQEPYGHRGIRCYKGGASLRLGDSAKDPSAQIHWIKFRDRYFSDRVILKRVSWDDLDRNGLVSGVKQKTRVFFDIDGTLAEWQALSCFEDMLVPGYFSSLPAYSNMLEAVRILAQEHSDELALYSLSHCLDEVKDARVQKDMWLDAHAPDIVGSHRFYCSCNKEKTEAAPGGVRTTDLLVDDYTKNLLSWTKQGKGIKVLNGVNHTRGTWAGPTVNKGSTPREIADAIYAAAMSN